MMLTENIRQAYDSLVINKKRTFLTMTGIVIGLSAVLFITSIGDTVSKLLEDFIVQNLIGGTQVALLSGYDEEKEEFTDDYKKYSFSIDEVYDFIDSSNGLILDISENSNANINGTVQVDIDHKADIILSGVSSAYEVTSKLHVISGRFISRDECRYAKPVAVISDIMAEKCFDSADDAIGKTIDMTGTYTEYLGYDETTFMPIYSEEKAVTSSFVVIGVYEYIKNNLFGDNGDATPVYCPFSYAADEYGFDTSFSRNNGSGSNVLPFIIKDRRSVSQAETMIKEFAESKYGSDKDYKYIIENTDSSLQQIRTTLKIVTYAFSLIAAISLLVGGIGLMNTMLVSVTERTREIGIKKALGAKTSTIRMQFLTESAFLCLVSCAIGVFFGFFCGMIVETNLDKLIAKIPNESLRYFLSNAEIHVTPSLNSIVFSSLFSIFVGVVFGFYPANKGAKMQPVDALRYE